MTTLTTTTRSTIAEPTHTRAKAPAPPLNIRPADERDKDDVIQIIRSSASWYEPFVEPEDMDEHLVGKRWADENFRKREFFVGRIEDDTVGALSIQEVGEDWLYLGYVYVHTDHVGKRIGGRLLRHAEREARRRGRRGLVLIAHPEAEWACRAYLKYGFELVAETREEVLDWEGGWLEPYYEEGFQLYRYELDD